MIWSVFLFTCLMRFPCRRLWAYATGYFNQRSFWKNILACIKSSLSTGMVFAESSSWGDMCFTKSMMMIELAGSWPWLGRGRSRETCLNDFDGNEYGNESE